MKTLTNEQSERRVDIPKINLERSKRFSKVFWNVAYPWMRLWFTIVILKRSNDSWLGNEYHHRHRRNSVSKSTAGDRKNNYSGIFEKANHYYELLLPRTNKKIPRGHQENRLAKLEAGMLFHQDNSRGHKAAVSLAANRKMGCSNCANTHPTNRSSTRWLRPPSSAQKTPQRQR